MAVQVLLFLLVFCLALLWRLGRLHRQPSHSKTGAMRTTMQRLLKPRSPLDCPSLYWLLGSSIPKQALQNWERSPSLACKQRQVGVHSEVITRILMHERRYSHVRETHWLWLVF